MVKHNQGKYTNVLDTGMSYGASIQDMYLSLKYSVSKRRVKKYVKRVRHIQWLTGQSCHIMLGSIPDYVMLDGFQEQHVSAQKYVANAKQVAVRCS